MTDKYKSRKIKYLETPITHFQKINRWNICQAIAKLYYHSGSLDTQLENIFEDLYRKHREGFLKNEK